MYVNDHLLVYGDEWSGDREIDGTWPWLSPATMKPLLKSPVSRAAVLMLLTSEAVLVSPAGL